MYDYNELRRAWIKFMDDFGAMDTFMGPGLIPSGRILEALDMKIIKWPGYGVGEDVANLKAMMEAAHEYGTYRK